MGVLDKSVDKLVAVYPMIDMTTGHLNTTVATAATAVGATTMAVASGTNSTNGDQVRIGSGESQEMATISSGGGTTSLTFAKPLKFAHAIGEAVVEQQALVLGPPDADGFKFNIAGESTDVFVATQALAYGVITGYVDITATFRFPTPTIDNLALALGIPRANVIGNGTTVAQTGTVGPRTFCSDGLLFGTISGVNLVAVFLRKDGTYARVEMYNVTFDPSSLSVTFARGQVAAVPVKVMASSAAVDFTNSAFAPANSLSTYQFSKSDLFSEMTDVQALTDSASVSTLNGNVTAGAYSFTATSGAALALVAGDIVSVGAGDTKEYHVVDNVSTNVVNLRTQILRAQANGAACAKQTRTSVGAINGGFTIGMAGSVSTLRAETSRVSIGYRVGNIAATMSFSCINVDSSQLLLALGINPAQFTNSVLPLNGNIGASPNATLLFYGLTQGGKTIMLIGWNGTVQIGGETTFSFSADALVPVSYKPNALLALVN